MRTALVTAVLVALLASQAASAAAPAGFSEATRLEAAASFVAGKPVVVYCAVTQYDWLQYGGTNHEYGLAAPGGADVKIAPDVCRYLRAKTINPSGFGASLLVLVHEAVHSRGESNEGVTDCAAIHEMPRVAVKFFGVKAGKQLRAVMANAWRYRSSESVAYRTVC